MPTYEYRCEKCRKKFTLLMTVADHDRRRQKCPKCGSQRVTQMLGAFYAQTSKKS